MHAKKCGKPDRMPRPRDGGMAALKKALRAEIRADVARAKKGGE